MHWTTAVASPGLDDVVADRRRHGDPVSKVKLASTTVALTKPLMTAGCSDSSAYARKPSILAQMAVFQSEQMAGAQVRRARRHAQCAQRQHHVRSVRCLLCVQITKTNFPGAALT